MKMDGSEGDTNKELYSIYKEPMVTDTVRSARLRWAGHVDRMNDNEPPKKTITSNPGGQRGRGHPKLRWSRGRSKKAWLPKLEDSGRK
jgi:hypothetical protein